MKKQLLRMISLFSLMLGFLLLTAIPCFAQKQNTTLRVAFYPLDGFFEYDEQGNESGYGVELLDKVTQASGIHFTYIKADSWEATKQMLLDGEADIRMPVTMPTQKSSELGYTEQSIIDTYHAVMTLKGRDDLYYEDYDTIKTLKLAVSSSFYGATEVQDYLSAMGLTEENLVFFDDYNSCRQALDDGKVDALVSNVMDLTGDMKTLARFNNISNYICMTAGNPMLLELDNALAQVKLNNPTFLSQIYKEYYPERTSTPLTREEEAYLSSIDTLRFAFYTDRGNLSNYENGVFYGIHPQIAQLVCEKLGVKCEQVPFYGGTLHDSSELQGIDVFADYVYDYNLAEEADLEITQPYFTSNYYLIQKRGRNLADTNDSIVAMVDSCGFTRNFVETVYADHPILLCDTHQECLDAIKDGKADFMIVNNYIAEYYLSSYQYSNLTATLTDYSNQVSYAVAHEKDGLLASILNKTLDSITQEEKDTIVIQTTAQMAEHTRQENILLSMIYRNPLQAVLIIAVIIAVIAIMVTLFIRGRYDKKRNQELLEAVNTKSEFMSRMSHDIRTPMGAVLALTRLAREEENVTQIKQYLEKIEDSGKYLLGLINDILDMTRIENGKINLKEEIVDGPAFLKSVLEMFRPMAESRGVILTADFTEAQTKWVMMDKMRSQQIYSNLLNNAIKFSPSGESVEWKVVDTLIDETHMKMVSTISDHGCGMSEEFMKRIFSPFEQEHNIYSDKQAGSGLGLAIVKNLVEQMDGKIEVDSKLRQGSVFTVTINRKISSIPPSSKEESAVESYDELKDRKILLCEDHAINADVMKHILEKSGMQVMLAENGEAGVKLFQESAIGELSAILMDVRMPVMDGLTAAKTIRKLERTDAAAIPIIAMTANTLEEDVKKTIEAGMNTHMVKPVDTKQLLQTLKTYIVEMGTSAD